MPTLDSSNIASLNCLREKKTMESGSNGSGEDRKEEEIDNTQPFITINNELIERDLSGTDDNNLIKVKLASTMEDNFPILQLSPQRSENVFATDDEDDDEASCISPSPEAYGNLKTTLIPSTPTRHSPSSNLSENSNGNAAGINSPNHSKISFNRQITKRITFSQDSASQLDTPVATKNQLSDFLNRNLELAEKHDSGNSLKRPINSSKSSSSDSSEIESVKLPKRRKETLSSEEDLIPKSPIRAKSRSRSCSPQLKESDENSDTPQISKEPQSKESTDVDDIHLYLSGTLGSLSTTQTQNYAINSDTILDNDNNKIPQRGKLSVEPEALDPDNAVLSKNQDLESNHGVPEETFDAVGQLEAIPIALFSTDEEKKLSRDSLAEKSFLSESTFIIESDNSAILTEDSNASGGLENSSFKTHYSESLEINKNAKSLQSNTRVRNRILDTQEISLALLSQSPIPVSQKRAHSSDENEPKKNLKTDDTSVQTPEFDSSLESNIGCKTRKKIIHQFFKDSFDPKGNLTKTILISAKVIKEYYLDGSDSSLNYHSSLNSGELADHSSLPLTKSTTSSSVENLNSTIGSSVANLSVGKLVSSNESLDPSPPVPSVPSNLPITAKKVLTNTSSSTSEENLFKTPKPKRSDTPKRKAKLIVTPPVILDESSSMSSPEIPLPKTPKNQPEDIPSDPRAIYPGARVLAKWGDGYYYPGMVGNKKSNEKWEVKFDDGSLRAVKNQDFFNAALINQGQSVLATSDDGEYFDSGVIVESYKDENGEGYIVDFDKGFTKKVSREKVILSGAQVQTIITPVSPILSTKLFGPGLDLENIVDGKRRRTPLTKTALVKSHRDPLLDSTEAESSTSTESDSKSSKKLTKTRGQKKLSPTKSSPNSKMPKDMEEKNCQNIKGIPLRSPRIKSKKCDSDEERKESTSKASGSKRSQYNESSTSPEIRRPGSSPPKPTQRTKRSLENEFDQLVNDIPEEKSTIFQGFYFLISCADRCSDRNQDSSSSSSFDRNELTPNSEITPFNKEYLLKLLELGGGRVFQNFEEIQTVSLKKVFLISNAYLRTLKYIKCLASGIPCIMFTWVLESIKQKKRLQIPEYILPAGYSIIQREIILWHGRNTILKNLHILLISRNNPMFVSTWKPVLLAAQAETVHRITNDNSPHSSLVNVIVSDQSCPSHIIRRANDLSIPIVSSEWVIQCLINGKKLPFNAHKKFDYMYDEN